MLPVAYAFIVPAYNMIFGLVVRSCTESTCDGLCRPKEDFLYCVRTACTRRLKTNKQLFGEGTCLVWPIHAFEPRVQTEKKAKYGNSLAHLQTSSPSVGRLHAVRTQCRNPL